MLRKQQQVLDTKTAVQSVDFVYSNLLDVSRIQIFFPIIVAWVFWGQLEPWKIILWSIASCLIYVARIVLTLQYRQRPPDETQPFKWGRRFAATSLASGLLWGYAAWLFYTPEAQTGLVLLYVTIVGTAAGAVMISSYWMPGYLFYAVPSVAMTALSLLYNGDINENILGAMLFLLLLMLVGVAFKTREQAYASIRLRFENLDLIDKLEAEKDRAEDASRAKTQFLASANHDLRQPVHALSLLSHTLKDELTTERGKTVYAQLNQTVANLNSLLESLLDLSQLESGALKVTPVDISLLQLAEQLKSEFLSLCMQKNLTFKVHTLDGHIHTDHTLLLRLLRNLLSNAVRYTNNGGVLLAFRQKGNDVLIQVWDTGIGIQQEDQKNVFREFFQVDNQARKNDEGLGLGLSICQKISALLDIPLGMRSNFGSGTVFTLTIPLVAKLPADQAPAITDHPNTSELTGKQVLIIDDDLIGLSAMSQVLTSFGIDTTLAQSAERALELAAELDRLDLIISDFRLSEQTTGIQLIRSLRRLPGLASVPALIVTGDTAPMVLKTIETANIPYLHKPINAGTLYDKLSTTIQSTPQTTEPITRTPAPA